jgi:hypothetical protein
MSKQPHILESESVEEFDALSASLRSELQPATETERTLVEMMIQHEWLMRRALRMQQQLTAAVGDESLVDPKRLQVVVRYYRTHERGYSQAKRQLESLRKHNRRVEKAVVRQSADSRHDQRQWEQILKKMPTLTNWVN